MADAQRKIGQADSMAEYSESVIIIVYGVYYAYFVMIIF